jgi:lysophospholipase L1-like esterase
LKQKLTYLALGDSYTIGELLPASENFPNQVCGLLNRQSVLIEKPLIIAKTGWTTDELMQGIIEADETEPLSKSYDFVSLLIGVNNQYRGHSPEQYLTDFEKLLKDAVKFAGNRKDNVIVLSIPDWGVTPFACERDQKQITKEIDVFNHINRSITAKMGIHYIYITDWTREAATDFSLLTSDGLHPSGKEYKRWAEKIADYFLKQINI